MGKYIDITNNGIFSILKENEADRIRAEQIKMTRDNNYNPYPNGWNRADFYKEVLSDMFIDGFVTTYPHGIVIQQAKRSYYYRGENQIYNCSQASLYRRLSKIENKNEELIEEFVAYMRIADFLELLLKFDHTQNFLSMSFSVNNMPFEFHIDLLYEQLAQHYGLETVWLDITSDFEVALFFACCKFNIKSNQWEPLNNDDFKINEQKQYGIIFQGFANRLNLMNLDSQRVKILPVGFQPFMRCHMHNSYVALLDKNYCLQKGNFFKILRFKHNEELCKYIFNLMENGKKIYPQEGLNLITEEIEEIKRKKIFSIDTFEYTYEEPKFKSLNKDYLKHLLLDFGYKITDTNNFIPTEKIKKINMEYIDFDIEKTYDIKLRTRLILL